MKKIILFLSAIVLIVALGCTNSSTALKVETKIRQLYSGEHTSIYGSAADTTLFSKDLVERIKHAQAATIADEQRIKNSEFPDDKPIMIEGSVFTSLYDGFSTYVIKNITVEHHKAEAEIAFEYNSTPQETWTDRVSLVYENGWKIDNVLFSDKNTPDKDLKQRLASVKNTNR